MPAKIFVYVCCNDEKFIRMRKRKTSSIERLLSRLCVRISVLCVSLSRVTCHLVQTMASLPKVCVGGYTELCKCSSTAPANSSVEESLCCAHLKINYLPVFLF